MSQGGLPLGGLPESLEPQRVHGQTSEHGHDLNAVHLSVAVRVFLELRVARRVPGVLNRPAVAQVLEQRLGPGAHAGDEVPDFVDELAAAAALAVDGGHHGTSGPVLLHPLRSRHAPQRPREVTSVFALVFAGLQRRLPSVDQLISDHLKTLAVTVFYCDQEVCRRHAARGRRKGRFACSTSACTSSPSISTRSSSIHHWG